MVLTFHILSNGQLFKCILFLFRHAFVQSEEAAISSSLLDAFEQGDQDLLDQVVRRPVVTYLDNEVAKLSRELQVPGGLSRQTPTTHIPPSESVTSNNIRQEYEQKNDFPIYNQHQSDSHFSYNQEQRENLFSLNVHTEKESDPLNGQAQKNDKQEYDVTLDETAEIPPTENQISLPPSSTTIPVPSSHSNFNQNIVVEEEEGLC